MKIVINIITEKVDLLLENDKGEIVDSIEWKEENNLSQKLLVEVDNLLKRNQLEVDQIEKMEVKSDIPERYTTNRIAKTIARTFNFAVKK